MTSDDEYNYEFDKFQDTEPDEEIISDEELFKFDAHQSLDTGDIIEQEKHKTFSQLTRSCEN